MSFLYPSFLWALGVLSIPVIIHLFNFRKTRKVFFSNTRVLKKVKEATTAKRKLKHYLILASRLLFLFFLVITFCQPFLPAREQVINNKNIVFYLDNSQSMSAQMEDKVRGIDAGVSFINRVMEVFPPDSRYRLITNDFAPYSNSYKTKKEVEELLAQVRLSPISRPMRDVLSRINPQQEDRSTELFFISDFQKSTLGLDDETRQADTTSRLHLVPIAFDSHANIFVDSVFLDNPFAAGGERNVLHVRLRNDGRQNVDQLAVKLTLNSVQAGTSSVSIAAGGVAETHFDLATGLTGLNKVRITFADFPISFDNEFFVSLNFTEKIRVVEIKNQAAPTPIEKVFSNAAIYNYKGFAVNNFNYSVLREADLVVVNGLNRIDPALSMALREYINEGNTLFFAPGKEPDLASYKNFLQLPMLNAASAAPMAELNKPDFNNPFFENVFEERSVAMVMPKATQQLDWGTDRTPILKFKNDKAFLSRWQQRGTVYVLASALETSVTDFYNHALFVPVMYKVAASSKKNDNRLYYTLQENFLSLRYDDSVRQDVQLKLVNDEEIIPEQRRVGDRILIDLPKFTMKQGFYNVVKGRDTVNVLAFNLDKSESLLAAHAVDEIKTLLGGGSNITIFDAGSTETFSREIKERYLGTPLWKYALLLALLFLVTEICLIRFLK